MATRLTDTVVKRLPEPPSGQRITYDDTIAGFGCRVTASGARAFILNYRNRSGRERRLTIGSFPDWKTSAARFEAGELKKRIDVGEDPMSEVEADRSAKTVADLCARYKEEYLPKLRPSSQREYLSLIDKTILPALRHLAVAAVEATDVDDLHRKMSKHAPYRANRAVAVIKRMFNLAIRWKWRSDNPANGIEKNQENERHRYLSGDELKRLAKALAAHPDAQAVSILRLLMLTGARRSEVQSAQWTQFDLKLGVWTKPGARTKQKMLHRVPISAPARQLLVQIHEDAESAAKKGHLELSPWVFPSHGESGHRVELKNDWAAICIAAGIVETETVVTAKGLQTVLKPSARMHDLRHTYASLLASSGRSLPVIGALLGHTQPRTTARYAHLLDDPLRDATESVGAIVTDKPSANVVPFKGPG